MLSRILPERLDNDYQGHPLALWMFFPITLMTLVRSAIHILRADGGAQSIGTIPLDTMTTHGAGAVVTVFALWGLSQMLLGLLYVVVLWRYRALLPLLYLLLLVEYVGRFLIGLAKPLVTLETPPGATGNFVMIAMALMLFVLSVQKRKLAPTGA
jgi:hypothetical protein